MNDKFRYTKQSIDPSILSVLDIAADGKVISAQDWTELWSLVIKRINNIDVFNVEVNEFCVAWDDTIKALTAVVEDFNNKYNALKDGFVHYGPDEPTNPHTVFWINETSDISGDLLVSRAIFDAGIASSANAIQNTVSGGKIVVNDVSPISHIVKVQLIKNLLPSTPFANPLEIGYSNGDGSYIINGTVATDNSLPIYVFISGATTTLENGTYALDLGTATSQVYLRISLTDDRYSTYEDYITDATGKVTFSVGNYNRIQALLLQAENGANIENLLIRPVFYKVSTDYSQVKLYRYGKDETDKLEFIPNADGTVDVPSLAPIMSLTTNTEGIVINANYNVDTKAYVDKNKGGGVSGENGATFIPNVSAEGIISWTNDKGLPNPTPMNIKGEQGERGLQGIQGIQGEKGDTGATGATGAKGDKGDQGEQGIQGIQGIQGPQGEQGPQGPKGEKGDKGDPYTLTETDKAEIVTSVISALPIYNGEVATV